MARTRKFTYKWSRKYPHGQKRFKVKNLYDIATQLNGPGMTDLANFNNEQQECLMEAIGACYSDSTGSTAHDLKKKVSPIFIPRGERRRVTSEMSSALLEGTVRICNFMTGT